MDFMKIALSEAKIGSDKGDGGPFGAVIVKDNKVVAKAHNCVLKTNDPTCHAEIFAIRKACKKLSRFDLSDCELYTNCEPCPMCFSAIMWAKIRKVYYVCTRDDAAKIGFDDKLIYDVIEGKKKGKIKSVRLDLPECRDFFYSWKDKKDKKMY